MEVYQALVDLIAPLLKLQFEISLSMKALHRPVARPQCAPPKSFQKVHLYRIYVELVGKGYL